LVEAISQRWNRYVIGYDLKTQVRIFEDLHRRYERLRADTGANRGTMERLTRPSVLAAGLLVVVLLVYLIWRSRRSPKPPKLGTDEPRIDPKLEAATALYRSLEVALALQGIPRPPSLPPLRHAQDLAKQQHPLAGSILTLTNRYIEARFGGVVIDEGAHRDYERRIKEIRSFRQIAPSLDSAP
jgi:hypothetical protein